MLIAWIKELRVREADASDRDWLAELVITMSREGHLANSELAGWAGAMIAGGAITVRSDGRLTTKRCRVLIGEARSPFRKVRVAGAIIADTVSDDIAPSPTNKKPELWVFGVQAIHRSRGYGKSFLRIIMSRYAVQGIFARCTPRSEEFIGMALQLGFRKLKVIPAGTLLEWSSC